MSHFMQVGSKLPAQSTESLICKNLLGTTLVLTVVFKIKPQQSHLLSIQP